MVDFNIKFLPRLNHIFKEGGKHLTFLLPVFSFRAQIVCFNVSHIGLWGGKAKEQGIFYFGKIWHRNSDGKNQEHSNNFMFFYYSFHVSGLSDGL